MSKRRGQRKKQLQRTWVPMVRGPANPALIEALRQHGENVDKASYEAWGNGTYDVLVRRRSDGVVHLSIKRLDRHAIRDWRHLQQIKNEILGPELMAVEIFPPESSLVDTSNEYHLWYAPKMKLPFLEMQATVMTPEEVAEANKRIGGKARQRPWQPGLTTGQKA